MRWDVSAPSASVVKRVRRPGWTPKFSQFIQDNRAVKSVNEKRQNIILKKASKLLTTRVPARAVCLNFTSQTFFYISQRVVVSLEDFSEQRYVGDGQLECVCLA